MTNSEPPFDVSAALKSGSELFASARADLLQTLDTYDTTGRELTKTTLERLQQLNDPVVSPARTAAVAGLTNELTDFDHLWIPLVGKAGFLLNAMVLALFSVGPRMIPTPVPSRTDTGGLDPLADVIAKALAFGDAVTAARQRSEILIASAVVVEAEVAGTVQEVVGLLTARLNLLAAFICRTDPAPENAGASPAWFVRTISKSGIDVVALNAAEEVLKAVVKEAPKHVPVAGIAASIIDITLDVREKQKAFRERRELLEKVAAAYRAPNATDDMSKLLAQFQQDDNTIMEFFQFIDGFTERLNSGFAV
jgi:hypothetical protein